MKHGKRLRVSFFYVIACPYTFSTRLDGCEAGQAGCEGNQDAARENTPRTKSSMPRFHH
jgi:hypothetical protein